MRMLSNIHTHTTFCDGADSAEEVVREAIKKGFVSLGFSGHSPVCGGEAYCMKNENAYISEITSLKEKYKDEIEIYLGIEQEYFSDKPEFKYDYMIGSVHYVAPGGTMRDVDLSEEYTNETVNKFYGGDYLSYIADYYSIVSDVMNKTEADVVGHFDLVTKFNEGEKYFSYGGKYEEIAFAAVDKLKGRLFEINTGAISRGYRTAPYPTENVLRRIFENGGEIIITSDCHNKKYLDCKFKEAAELAESCGFKYCKILYNNKLGDFRVSDVYF